MKVCRVCSLNKNDSDFYPGFGTCKSCNHEKQREARKSPEGKARSAAYRRRARLKRYGLTPETYAKMLEQQNGRCAVCFAKPSDYPLVVDHCHATDEVRGLLCNNCNVLLGHARDNAEILQAAIDYLRSKEVI